MTEIAEKSAVIERIKLGMKAKALNDRALGELLGGITRQSVNQFLNSSTSGRRVSGAKHWPRIAGILGCSIEWLTTGHGEPPSWADRKPETSEYRKRDENSAPLELPLVGKVAAGDGDVEWWQDHPESFRLSPHWKVMRVEGNSAYPVAWPNQFVLVDTSGEAPRHNNLVVIQVRHPTGPRSYLKRYCVAENAPDGFVLASVDVGKDTPYVPQKDILTMIRVVGVLFEAAQ